MSKKDKNAPIMILEASKQPFLSIGTIYGAINTYGQDYTYIKTQDVFLRNDYLKEYNKFKKWDEFTENIKNKKND
jgi:hypothetical protein